MRMVTKAMSWEFYPSPNRKLEMRVHFVGWFSIQLGVHIDFAMKNVEVFFPFFFIHVGFESRVKNVVYTEARPKDMKCKTKNT